MDKSSNFNAWYVMIAVLAVLLVQAVFQQSRQTEVLPYSQFRAFLEQGKVGELVITESRIVGKLKDAARRRARQFRHRAGRPGVRPGARELRGRVPRRQRRELLHHSSVLGAAGADLLRHLDLPAAPHVDGRHGRGRPDVDRQEQGQDLRREGHQDLARRRRRRRRGQGRAPGDHRFPQGSQGLRRARRAPAARRAAGRPARHRQDAAWRARSPARRA